MPPAAVVAVLLTPFSNGYGYDRDELYFSMLKPGLGVRRPAAVDAVVAHGLDLAVRRRSVAAPGPGDPVCSGLPGAHGAARARAGRRGEGPGLDRLGDGDHLAVLLFGHVLLTSSADLVAWPLVCLCVVRAELRDRPRWWLVAGAVAGLATYNKLLVGRAAGGHRAGLALVGPRRRLASPYVWGGAAVAVLVALPNVLYQVTNGWPELRDGPRARRPTTPPTSASRCGPCCWCSSGRRWW